MNRNGTCVKKFRNPKILPRKLDYKTSSSKLGKTDDTRKQQTLANFALFIGKLFLNFGGGSSDFRNG